jgi:CBS domain-containing protein
MSRDVRVLETHSTIQCAARLMQEIDTGFLPVVEDHQIVGVVTDRDIVIRAVAHGLPLSCAVRDIMTTGTSTCREDEAAEDVLERMADRQVHRLPVVDIAERIVGIVTIGDLAWRGADQRAGEALAGIVRPSGQHSQSTALD